MHSGLHRRNVQDAVGSTMHNEGVSPQDTPNGGPALAPRPYHPPIYAGHAILVPISQTRQANR